MTKEWGFEGLPVALGGDEPGRADERLRAMATAFVHGDLVDAWVVDILAPALPGEVAELPDPGIPGWPGLLVMVVVLAARMVHRHHEREHRSPEHNPRPAVLALTADGRLVLIGLQADDPRHIPTTVLAEGTIQTAHLGNPLSVGGYVVSFDLIS